MIVFIFSISFSNKKYLDKAIIYGYLFNLKKLITISTFGSLVTQVSQFSRSIVFILSLNFFKIFISKKHSSRLINIISIYIIISTIPFHLNLIESLTQGYDLFKYGVDSYGFIGIFQKAHPASISFSLASCVIFYNFINEPLGLKKVIYCILFIIGIYSLIFTYVRVGIVMLIFGIIIIYLDKINIRSIVKLSPIFLIIGYSIIWTYQNNEIIQMRFNDTNIYSKNMSSDNLGSGRLTIASYAIQNWIDEGNISLLIGMGEELSRKKMEKTKGTAVFAHNGFVEIIQTDGIIGLFLFLAMIFHIYKNYIRGSLIFYNLNKLYLGIFIMYLIFLLFQGGDNIIMYILLALSLNSLTNKKNQLNEFSTTKNLQ